MGGIVSTTTDEQPDHNVHEVFLSFLHRTMPGMDFVFSSWAHHRFWRVFSLLKNPNWNCAAYLGRDLKNSTVFQAKGCEFTTPDAACIQRYNL